MLWKRGKVKWLREGDKNTAFFRARANERRKRNSIKSLRRNSGALISESSVIQGAILRHFTQIFQSSCPDQSIMEEVVATFSQRVMREMNDTLLQPFSLKRLTVLLIRCTYPYKLPGAGCPCNVVYKLASKVIAKRIKPLLNNIISDSQSAFILGRLITDNVLVNYEPNYYLAHKRWGSVGHAAFKLDISKAYDKVEWVFS
ncbi:UNVERIFIED_CONTAM: hypothetical protein Slati_2169300 [Sesamum latifolium]|uniref:Reverse transcriptase n=1 Tax=Sesamum latifolium TaxID=2727402 RepID=A0AAW2WUR0_9LAMI